MASGQLVGDVTGAIGRLVVHDQDVQSGDAQAKQRPGHGPDVFGLIVGGDDDGQFHWHPYLQKDPGYA